MTPLNIGDLLPHVNVTIGGRFVIESISAIFRRVKVCP